MNERIKELAEQCTSWSDGSTWTSREVFDKEKFAKLIVQECALIVENSPWQLRRGYKAIDQANLVKQHFGVKV
jgi:hypothetical protein